MNFFKNILYLTILFASLFSQEYSRFTYNPNSDNLEFDSHLDYTLEKFPLKYDNQIFIDYTYMSSLFDYSSFYYDSNNFLLMYYGNKKFNDKVEFAYSIYAENSKKKFRDENIIYWNDSHFGASIDLEKGYLSYVDELIFVKIGRDYFQPGYYTRDRILFSSKGYSFDQVLFGFINDKLSISSFYLALSPHPYPSMHDQMIDVTRHLNGHRINYDFENGYLALNELILYGGDNKPINISLFNPFLPYYLYHKNHGNFASNSIVSLEYLYSKNNIDLFFEFVLDDFQIDKKSSSDLEPNEYAFLFDFKQKLNNRIFFNINYLMISNRTFNVRFFPHEKYINKNLPIGHFLGNNFWNINLGLKYNNSNYLLGFEYVHLVKGDEALYSTFNTDYLDFSIQEGYSEDFPFGVNQIMNGAILNFQYGLKHDFFISTSIAYWGKTIYDNLGLNYLLSMNYKINLDN